MSSRTTNLNLEKPANTDYVDVDVINSNSDKIDTFAGQVLNGDYVQDSNYVHTDNNFTSTLKNKLDGVEANANNYSLPTASTGTLGGVKVDGSTITIDSNGIISSTGGGGGGTTVIANPSGTATAALEKLQVGQTIYSSGGTTVIGNPSGTPTADLEKIQIGNSVFKIPEASLYTPTGLSYTVTMEAVASRTQFDCFLTEYEDGTQTSQNDYSFVKAAAGISEVTVGKVKLQNASGNIQVIALADMLQYNGNVFNTNDVIATILLPSTNVPAVSMTIEEVEFPIAWNQIQQSGAKIAEITINGTTTNVYAPSGGGSGSTVGWTQITESGTKIAEIEIDGVSTNVYAPTSGGASALNDLSDVTVSSATNGQVLKYNSTSNKWENSNESGGTTVVANPQETATQELTTIQIGEIVYSVSSGGGGGTGSGKTLVKKTKTYTGDGQRPLVVTFDEKPLLVYSIYGPGLNETNTVRMYPFVYGEIKTSGRYINNDASSGNIGYTIAYSNNDLTMSVTSNPQDTGAGLNNNGSSYTITYLVEENTSGGDYKDLVRTLTVGTTSLTISDVEITSTTTPLIWTSSPLVAPTNMVVTTGSITLTFEAQQSNVDVLVRLTKSNAERSYDISLKQFVTGKVFPFTSTQYSTIEEVSNGIKMSGGTTANDWTTNSTVGIDLQQYTIPSGLSKINIHFASIETTDYAGICIINSDTLFSGTSPYDDILRASRIYQFEDTTGVDLTDYDIEFNCSSLTGRYLYIMCCDGITPNTPEYDNAKNGTFNVIVDGLNFITGGGE